MQLREPQRVGAGLGGSGEGLPSPSGRTPVAHGCAGTPEWSGIRSDFKDEDMTNFTLPN